MTWLRPRIVMEASQYKVVEFPFWVPEAVLRKAADNVCRDAEIKGCKLTITVGHRLMRIEGLPK